MDDILQTGADLHVDCGDMVKIETRCRIPIRRTFGQIPWHVIPEPPATLQGIIIPSAVLKIVSRHIFYLFFWFLPRDAMHKRGICRHAVSVCLSVTFVDYVKRNKHIFEIFSPLVATPF